MSQMEKRKLERLFWQKKVFKSEKQQGKHLRSNRKTKCLHLPLRASVAFSFEGVLELLSKQLHTIKYNDLTLLLTYKTEIFSY